MDANYKHMRQLKWLLSAQAVLCVGEQCAIQSSVGNRVLTQFIVGCYFRPSGIICTIGQIQLHSNNDSIIQNNLLAIGNNK